MRTLRYRRGETGDRLAEAWGLSRQRVRELCAEASKRLKRDHRRGEAKRDVTVALRRALSGAMKNGDWRGAALISKQISALYGLDAPKQLELTGKNGGPVELSIDLSTLTDAELEALARGERPPGSPRSS
jgi:nucleotidyltransferase/DNA polymerase involved in DNA repair